MSRSRTYLPRRHFLVLAAIGLGLFITACGDDDESIDVAEPQMAMIELRLTSHYEGPFEMDGMTIEFSTATLGVQEVALFEAASHDGIRFRHNYGEDHGDPVMTTRPYAADLVNSPMVLGTMERDFEGHFSNVVVSLAPATSGPGDGYTMLLEGRASRDGLQRPFRVEWIAREIPFVEFADLSFHHDGKSVSVFLLGLHHDEILRGVDLMNLGKPSEMLVINRSTFPDVLGLIEDNMEYDFHAHDDTGSHQH